MGNVIMKAQQITYGASNVEKALDDLNVPELIELNKRMDAVDAWKANVHEETYTGSELTIENALALPARSLITSINAIQDLHGYDHPWVGGAGKNKVDDSTIEGGYYYDGDGSKSPSSNTLCRLPIVKCEPNTAYTLYCSTNVYTVWFFSGVSDSDSISKIGNVADTTVTFTTPDNCTYLRISLYGDYTSSRQVQLELGSTATSYEPYANICPISGRTAAVITRSDGDEISEDFTLQLGTTVYGADINWDTGVMSVLRRAYDMGELNYEYLSDNNAFRSTSALPDATTENVFINSISSIYKEHQTGMANMTDGEFRVQGGIIYLKDFRFTSASDLKTALSGQTVVYDIATPSTIQLTPTQLEMLKGYNRITVASGYATIELKALVLGGDN